MGYIFGGSLIALVVALGAYFAFRGDEEVVPTPTPPPTIEASTTPEEEATKEPTNEPAEVETPDDGASAEPSPSPTPDARPSEHAPIESVVVEFIDGQHVIVISAGLPSGCHDPLAQVVTREADVFMVTITNSPPEPGEVCSAEFRTYEVQITIGEALQAGLEYAVRVNDHETTFTAQ